MPIEDYKELQTIADGCTFFDLASFKGTREWGLPFVRNYCYRLSPESQMKTAFIIHDFCFWGTQAFQFRAFLAFYPVLMYNTLEKKLEG